VRCFFSDRFAPRPIMLYALDRRGGRRLRRRLTGPAGGAVMAVAFKLRHFRAGAHHRLWLFIAALLAFLMAALWTQPAG
jgi:hypothetical protein